MSNTSNDYINNIKSIVEKEMEKTSLLRELSLLLGDDPLMPNANSPNNILYKPNEDIINNIKEIIHSKNNSLNNSKNNFLNNSGVNLRIKQLDNIHKIKLMPKKNNITSGGRKKCVTKK